MTILEDINLGIKEAMKARELLRLDTLRMLKSKILTVDARGNLEDAEVIKLFKTYFGNLEEALEQAKAFNRTEIAEKLKCELEIVLEFLPKALTLEETKKLVAQAIVDSQAKSKRDLGLVMKSLMKISPHVDGKLAKRLADELLTE